MHLEGGMVTGMREGECVETMEVVGEGMVEEVNLVTGVSLRTGTGEEDIQTVEVMGIRGTIKWGVLVAV